MSLTTKSRAEEDSLRGAYILTPRMENNTYDFAIECDSAPYVSVCMDLPTFKSIRKDSKVRTVYENKLVETNGYTFSDLLIVSLASVVVGFVICRVIDNHNQDNQNSAYVKLGILSFQ